jgi:hypothetical protein
MRTLNFTLPYQLSAFAYILSSHKPTMIPLHSTYICVYITPTILVVSHKIYSNTPYTIQLPTPTLILDSNTTHTKNTE